MRIQQLFTLILIAGSISYANAQTADSLMRSMDQQSGGGAVSAAFKSDRLILSQTTAMVKKYDMDFKVGHRFGDIGGTDGGGKTFWGFDNSSDIYIGFDYGISDRLNVGFGRSKYEQLLDLQLKYALLQQSTDNHSPFSVSVLVKTGFTPYKVSTTVFNNYLNRFSYFEEAIISRKVSSRFSFQVSPSLLQRKVLLSSSDEPDLFSLGGAFRYKFTPRFGIVSDYIHVFSAYRDRLTTTNYVDPLGIGIEIETGGHVFTMNFVNAKAIIENNLIPNSTSSWSEGQYRFGFTVSRMFTLHTPKTN